MQDQHLWNTFEEANRVLKGGMQCPCSLVGRMGNTGYLSPLDGALDEPSQRRASHPLSRCGFTREAIETTQSVVSELTTNAFNAAGSRSDARPTYSELMKSGIIGLSLRHFPNALLIEVLDASAEPPVLVQPEAFSEHGRGVWLVAALSREWGYFAVGGGKCVYSILGLAG